ncbi:hypothetical protein JOF56_007719 [Kibdelosporangium banguiense]|uniref:NACHT domain-containing protein n=1 Tax=Kibdelosporangium banguiense TaxID=1365924 RepID=A0ABS4TSE4_9PSEU|nr:NACHT domain-containing protein [Kibdelosporangium banguiense]MBP2327334.1 hypothetical protein [Kibdelosporangium banguiense]
MPGKPRAKGRRMTDNRIEGNVWGQALQAGSIEGGVQFVLNATSAAPPRPEHEPVAAWEKITEPPDEIRSVLNAQMQAAHKLPYRLPGARRPSLATVYVRQDLSSGTEEQRSETSRPTPVLDDHGQLVEVLRAPTVRVAVRPPARTVREALDANEHLIVTGGAGQGKSTLSLRLAADTASRWYDSAADDPLTEPVIPLRLSARELAARLDLPFAQALADSANAECGALLGAPLQSDLVSDRALGCRWLLLVDGLDEVADAADRDSLADVLAAWASAPESPYRVVVTTRPIEGAALAPLQRIKAARYELQPFDEQALIRFAENWFDEEGLDHAHRFVRQIRDAHLDELVRVPLLATIAAIIFQQEDRPLPDNQYELYESYLAFLRSARKSSSIFEPHHTALLEHLGKTRSETDTSLVGAARDWIRRSVDQLPHGWSEDLTAYLISGGLLVMRGNDLSFLHHSFAEHLAATAQARLLPEHFDSSNDDFARLLYAARPKERGEYARSVLLHYTRLHPDEADPLVCWLHTGGTEQHLLAARLLAKRVPASHAVMTAFLATVRARAMTTTAFSGEILSQASRATHYPGLAEWLLGLMHTEDAPWQSRTEAAAALATRLHGKHFREAVTYLSDVVDDVDTSIEQRLTAAERGLRAVLSNPRATGLQYRTAAVTLAVFGGHAREFAINTLTSLLTDDSPVTDLVEAATGLVEIGPEFHDQAAAIFRQVLRDPVLSTVGRRDAALGLVSLGPAQAAEAVSLVNTLIIDRRRSSTDRFDLARVLGDLGPQHRNAAVDHVESILAEPGLTGNDRWWGADQIAEFGLDFRDRAIRHLRSTIAAPRTTAVAVGRSVRSLAKLSPEFVHEAATELQRLLNETSTTGTITRLHGVESWRVRAAVNRLGRKARTRLEHDLLHNRSAPIDERVPDTDVWDDNPLADEAEQAIRAVIDAPESSASERIKAAVALAQLSLAFVPEAAAFLRGFLPGQQCATAARKELASLGQKHFDHVIAETLDLVRDEAQATRARSRASFLVGDLVTFLPGEVSDFLLQIATDERTSDRDQLTALYALRTTNGLDAVRAVRDEVRRSPGTRVQAAVHLANFDVSDRAVGARLLNDLATDSSCHPALRLFAARELDNFGQAVRDLSVPALHSLLTDESASGAVRAEAARLLFIRSPSDRRMVLKQLNTLLTTAKPLHRIQVLMGNRRGRPRYRRPRPGTDDAGPTPQRLGAAEIRRSRGQTAAL